MVGARNLDPPEVSYRAGSPITRRDVVGLDPADLPDLPVYVHVGLDALDPAEVPGLRYPALAGPAAEQLAASLRLLMATGRVAAIEHDVHARVAEALRKPGATSYDRRGIPGKPNLTGPERETPTSEARRARGVGVAYVAGVAVVSGKHPANKSGGGG